MSLDVPLQVAISLAFIFAMFSLMVSAVQELAASATKLRARTFVEGVRQLLDQSSGTSSGWSVLRTARGSLDGSPLFKSALEHPLIQGGSTRSIPSYATARAFGLAVLDHLNGAKTQLDADGIEAAIAKIANPKAQPPCGHCTRKREVISTRSRPRSKGGSTTPWTG